MSSLFPGNTGPAQPVRNPVSGDPEALQRGMAYFNMFNCVGCHAPNGGGGMGPSLSNKFFIYGGEPQNIYLSIYQGRPNGMPSWGAMLPENIIWDLVAYVGSISKDPSSTWGETMSHDAFKIEQTPAGFAQTATPWSQTQRFGFGQKPNERR
ncbi:c-type cytochrome [Methylocystis sp. JAN1]|uniref:c-type cytochrome n=1 Tax=Methylocystis sp. JAN1 TaxID=3397211 RepID=UPI003FA1F782